MKWIGREICPTASQYIGIVPMIVGISRNTIDLEIRSLRTQTKLQEVEPPFTSTEAVRPSF